FHLVQGGQPTSAPVEMELDAPRGGRFVGSSSSISNKGGSRQARPSRWNSTLPGEAAFLGSSSTISNKEGSRQARPSRWNSTLPGEAAFMEVRVPPRTRRAADKPARRGGTRRSQGRPFFWEVQAPS